MTGESFHHIFSSIMMNNNLLEVKGQYLKREVICICYFELDLQ